MPPPVYRPAPIAAQQNAPPLPTSTRSAAPPVYRPVLPLASGGQTGSRPAAPAPPHSAVAGPQGYRPNVAAPLQPKQGLTAPGAYRPQPLVQMARRGARGGPNLRAQYAAAILVIIANIIAGNPPLDDVDDLVDAPDGVADQVVGLARGDILRQQQAAALRAQRQQQRDGQRQLRRQFRGNSRFN